MQFNRCRYCQSFHYALSIFYSLAKNIPKIIRLKFGAFKMIVFKFYFLKRKYHSPIMPIASAMINAAMNAVPFFDRPHMKCVCETTACLIDAIEKLTHCSRENGRLKVYDYGHYAATFYDSETLEGVRVYIDTQKLKKNSGLLFKYFVKTQGPKPVFDNNEVFIEAIKKADKVFSVRKVIMSEEFFGRGTGRKVWGVCAECNEASHIHVFEQANAEKKNEKSANRDDGARAICVECFKSNLYQSKEK